LRTPARFSGVARREFAKVLDDIVHAAAAEKLRRAVETAAGRIGRQPALGRRELSLADERYRFWSVSGFPYVMIYRADLWPPAVVRFVHTSRDLPVLLAGLSDLGDDMP